MTTARLARLPADSKIVNAEALRGLDQALFVLNCLCNGEIEDDIVLKFNGDKELVNMWVSFLKHNHWLYYDAVKECWAQTGKGKEWAKRVNRI